MNALTPLHYEVDEAAVTDADDIARIQHEGRLATYVDETLGITTFDVEQKLGSVEGRARRWRQRLNRCEEAQRIFTLRNNGRVIGFCKVEKRETKSNYVHTVYVDLAYLGRGVGTALLHHALTWLGNVRPVELRVISSNSRAMEFYRNLGFVVAGVAEPYMVGEGKAIPMTLMRRGE